MKKILLTLSICMLPIFTLANPRLNQHTGWFASMGVGIKANFLPVLRNSATFDNSQAAILTIGNFISPRFAWELDALNGNFFDPNNDREDVDFYGGSLRWLFPIGDRANFYTKLGAGEYHEKEPASSLNEKRFTPYDGIGFSYALNKKVDLGISYQGAILLIVDEGVVSGNLTYHF